MWSKTLKTLMIKYSVNYNVHMQKDFVEVTAVNCTCTYINTACFMLATENQFHLAINFNLYWFGFILGGLYVAINNVQVISGLAYTGSTVMCFYLQLKFIYMAKKFIRLSKKIKFSMLLFYSDM